MITKTASPTPPAPSTPHEDSHVFSLEALRAREQATASATAQAADDSGVIDLDALRLQGSVADDLTTRRLVPVATDPDPPRRHTPRWAVGAVGLLGGAVMALATMVAVGVPHGTPATQDPTPRPTMAAAVLDAAPTTHGLDTLPVIPHASAAEATPPPADAPAVEATTEAPRKATRRSRSTTSKRKAKTTRSKTTRKSTPAPAPKATPAPTPKADNDPSVQCILDPASCGRGAKPKAKAQPKAPTTNLPTKLSASQIRKALSGPKAQAKQCKDMHAAPAGTTVKVKLSIAGSGEVRSATPQAPHANGLGRCVADALGRAEFEPFAAPAMGVVYSVRL